MRIAALDMMRGTAVLLMAFMHSVFWGEYGGTLPAYAMTSNALSGLRMPVLLLISGIAASRLLYVDNYGPALRRCVALMWLYLMWLPLNLVNRTSTSAISLELINPTTLLWFIWVLALLTATIPFLRKISRNLATVITLSVSTVSYKYEIPEMWLANLLHWSCFFYVGALYRTEILQFLRANLSIWTWTALLSFIALIHIVNANFEAAAGWPALAVIERLAICSAGLFSMRIIERYSAFAAILTYVGKRTLPIYVIHAPIIWLVRGVMPDFGAYTNIVTPLLIAACSVTFSLLIYTVASKLGLHWLFKAPHAVMRMFTRERLRMAGGRFA